MISKQFNSKIPLLSLYYYAFTVSSISTMTHYLTDGFFSLSFWSSIVFSIVLHFKTINQSIDDLHLRLRRKHIQTSIIIFSTTILATLRVACISLSRRESTVSLYLAYLSLFIAFSDNLQLMSDCESYRPTTSEYRPVRQNPRRAPIYQPRYAPAG